VRLPIDRGGKSTIAPSAGRALLDGGKRPSYLCLKETVPPPPADHAVTALLQAWGAGDLGARDHLIPLVYGEPRRRAPHDLRHERPGHTLQPMALVIRGLTQGQSLDTRSP
jgi:hypothetical protein